MTENNVLTGYTPPKRRFPAVVISGICLTAAAALLIISALGIGWRSVIQLAAAAFAVAAIEITTRFILTQYTYTVVYGSNGIDFTVSKPSGGKIKTVASIAMMTVKAVRPYKKPGELDKTYGHIGRIFNYTVNIFPVKKGQIREDPDAETGKYAVIFDFNGSTDVMIIESSEDYYRYISDILNTPSDVGADPDGKE